MENSDIEHTGSLFQKSSYMGKKKWIEIFFKLYKGSIYIYPNANAIKPKMVANLAAYSKIEIITGRTKFPLYVIAILPSLQTSSVVHLVFGTTTEPEMEFIVKLFEVSIRKSKENLFRFNQANSENIIWKNNALCTQNASRDSLARSSQIELPESSFNPNEYDYCISSNESLNYDVAERNYKTDSEGCILREVYFDYKDALLQDTRQDNKNIGNNLTIYYDDYHFNLDDVIFKGTSPEAFQEMQKNICVGAYLVRQEKERQVLTVQCTDSVLKYVLNTNQNNSCIQIQDQEIMFNSLRDLLSYYHKNDIPGRRCKLVIPYKCLIKN